MTAKELKKKYLDFFVKKGHKKLPSASLIPGDDPTTLFTGSGMQQLVPYLKGKPHPMGKLLVNSQPCFRAEDIGEVGNNRHTTFFEMLGNWSLGDYFKEKQLSWFFEFLIEIVGLDSKRLYVTVFDGDENYKVIRNGKYQPLGPDVESISIWRKLFRTGSARPGKEGFNPKIKIYTYEAEKNWWSRAGTPERMPVGEIGGPDSEMFYDFGEDLRMHENSPFKNQKCHLNCDCGRFLEIGNSVFMQYEKQTDGLFKPLPNKNVDFGGGLERITATSINSPDIFKIDLFWPIIREIEKFCNRRYERNESPMRIIADHLKGATFMIAEGVEPSNKQQGYVLRRLLRRSAVKMHQLSGGLTPIPAFEAICHEVIRIYGNEYFEEKKARNLVSEVVEKEVDKFGKALDRGLKKFERATNEELNTLFAFDLFQTYGFPLEITEELFKQKGKVINKKEFEDVYKKHQELSRTASEGMFRGGLADHSEIVTKLHTATHLLHQALRDVLGKHVQQVGSNITPERLRFDFTHPEKLTEAEIKQVEEIIRRQIKANLPVKTEMMNLDEAKKKGALAFFADKYEDKVKVYYIGNYSCEVCGGPHISSTGEIGSVKIIREKPVGAGRRRIYAGLV